ncbi:MAG: hypothetical protein EZS28_025691 [Streblomastix strix]|uniref:Uncharacterized protein n=1 Tax=Streblomastix strix TaxID=222440 RepID=A0A5J4V8G0_9EUKA|nr:MAG: hypothetical protein EZS28_025691 [Streblomastix strix]
MFFVCSSVDLACDLLELACNVRRCCITITLAWNDSASCGRSCFEQQQTNPLFVSLTDTYFKWNPKLSHTTACGIATWCISTDLHSLMIIAGAIVTTCPIVRIQTSICRTITYNRY